MSHRMAGPRSTPEVSRVRTPTYGHERQSSDAFYEHRRMASNATATTTATATRPAAVASDEPQHHHLHHRSPSAAHMHAYESKFDDGVLARARTLNGSQRAEDEDDADGEDAAASARVRWLDDEDEIPVQRVKVKSSPSTSVSPAGARALSPRRGLLSESVNRMTADITPLPSPFATPIATPPAATPSIATPPSTSMQRADHAALAARFLRAASSSEAVAQPLASLSPTGGSRASVFQARPMLSGCHIYHRGYLKQKVLTRTSPDAPPVLHRGKAGLKKYFVWHSKGLSIYASEKAYEKDQRPERQMLNAWNSKYRPNGVEEEELPELALVPYTTANAATDSISMLLQAQADELLLQLLLCKPSAAARPPPNALLMVLKASTPSDAKTWLSASSRLRTTRERDRRMHTSVLPMLQKLIEDPNGFILSHATQDSEISVEEVADLTRGDTLEQASPPPMGRGLSLDRSKESLPTVHETDSASPPRSLHVDVDASTSPVASKAGAEAVEPFVTPAKMRSTESASPSPSPSPESSSNEPTSTRPAPLQVAADTVAPSLSSTADAAAHSEPVSTIESSDRSDSPSHSRQNSRHQVYNAADQRAMGLAPFSPTGFGGGAFSISPSLAAATTPRSPTTQIVPVGAPRVARALSVQAPGLPAAATSPDQQASSTCRFYALNGETPLFPEIPLGSIGRFDMSAVKTHSFGSSPSLSPSSLLVQLDQLGPRRCTVHDLLQWLLLRFPGSTFVLPEPTLTSEAKSPQSPLSPVSPPSSWDHAHLTYAFLLFHPCFLDSHQLVEWLAEFWHESLKLDDLQPHTAHHLRANIMHVVLVWIEHFRRDYLDVKTEMDPFLKDQIYPHAVEFARTAELASKKSRSCVEWTRADHPSLEPEGPACVHVAALAANIANTIALTSGAPGSVLDGMMTVPKEWLELGAKHHAATPLEPSTPVAGNGATSPRRPSLARTATSPLARRQSFAVHSASARDLMSGPASPRSPLSSSAPASSSVGLHSQAHRLPQCFAHRASTLSFMKKFVGFGVSSRLLDFPPEALAHELTNADVELLQCVHTRELVGKVWTRPQARIAQAGQVINFIESFNRRSFWVATEIMRAGGAGGGTSAAAGGGGPSSGIDVAAQVTMCTYFVNVLVELVRLNNFYAVFALLNGLGLQPLFRLQAIWDGLPPAASDVLARIRTEFDARANHARFRARWKRAVQNGQAHVGHFAVLLKDLFQLEEIPTWAKDASAADPLLLSDPPRQVLNWSKYAKAYCEVWNSFLVGQNLVRAYEREQPVDGIDGMAPVALASPRRASILSQPASPPRIAPPTTRPPLPASDPTLRMSLHLALQRVWNEEKLYEYSYRCKPKSKT